MEITQIEGLVKLLTGKKEIDGLRIKATINDVEDFALLALDQLVNDGSLAIVERRVKGRTTQDYVKGVIESIKSDLAEAIWGAMDQLDAVVELGDEIARVGKL